MVESKSFDRSFNGFQSRMLRDDTDGGAGITTWTNFNPDLNLMGEGSNLFHSSWFNTKMDQILPTLTDNIPDVPGSCNYCKNLGKNNKLGIKQENACRCGTNLNELMENNASSDRLFRSMSRLPDNSLFSSVQNNNLNFLERLKKEEEPSNMLPPPHQHYFPFVIEYRKPLPPIVLEEEPIYVNAKQYERIMKMRLKRAKAGIIRTPKPSENKKCKYQSRSTHAKKRQRDEHGRFYKKFDKNEGNQNAEREKIIRDTMKIQKKTIS